jgi:single-strand DNA-binding protein
MGYRGTVKAITDVRNISDKFRIRTVVLSDTNEKYPQEIEFQATNERMGLLDGVKVGDVLDIDYNLRGRGREGKDGVTRYYNQLDIWRVNRGESTQPTNAQRDYPQFDGVPF